MGTVADRQRIAPRRLCMVRNAPLISRRVAVDGRNACLDMVTCRRLQLIQWQPPVWQVEPKCPPIRRPSPVRRICMRSARLIILALPALLACAWAAPQQRVVAFLPFWSQARPLRTLSSL